MFNGGYKPLYEALESNFILLSIGMSNLIIYIMGCYNLLLFGVVAVLCSM